MSVKDAPGEVNENPNFDSPNITTAEEEEQQAIAAEKEARKKAETVEIDGIPIEGDDVKFKASDISKKGKANYFVNIEGEEERKRQAAKKAKAEAEEEAKAQKRAARVMKELKAEEEAKQKAEEAEAAKRQKAEDIRVMNELKQKAKDRKKQNRTIAREEQRRKNEEKQRARKSEIAYNLAKIRKFLFGGWHKFVTILIIAVIIIVPTIIIADHLVKEQKAREEAAFQKEIEDLQNEIINYQNEDAKGNKDKIIENATKLDDKLQTETTAIDMMNIALYYDDMDLYEKYLQICKDRGGCQDDPEGKG